MRRWIALSLAFVLCVPFASYAAPVGNIASPAVEKGKFGIKAGAEADFVFSRELDVEDEDVELEANFYTAKISYTLLDRLDIYAILGSLSGAEVTEKYGSTTLKYGVDDAFVWGAGLTVLAYEWDNGFRVGIDGKYRSSEPGISSINLNGTDYSLVDSEGSFKEWQFALAVSKQFGKFIPYAGVKYSDMELSAKGTISGTVYQTDKVGGKNLTGLFVGASFLPKDNISINIEGRFIDETAMNVGLSYKF